MIFAKEDELVALGNELRQRDYSFTTVTPETHGRIFGRRSRDVLRSFFGWNRAHAHDELPKSVVELAEGAGVIEKTAAGLRSRVRVSTLGDRFYFHSSYPTDQKDSVFFGPDSYRFVRLLESKFGSQSQSNRWSPQSVVDIGCGSGIGAIEAARVIHHQFGTTPALIFTDVNDEALACSRINLRLNARYFKNPNRAQFIKSDLLKQVPPGADLLIANPPFIIDEHARSYRHGGDNYGTDLSFRIFDSARQYLAESGTLLMYTGSCLVDGQDILHTRLLKASIPDFDLNYEEIDPDIFGEELSQPPYADVERIAAVGVTLTHRR